MKKNIVHLTSKKLIFLALIIMFLFMGCIASNDTWRYANSPYYLYTYHSTGKTYGEKKEKIRNLVEQTKKYPNDATLHSEIASWAFHESHLGTTLYALNEILRLNPNHMKSQFNVALIFSMIGLNDEAKAKLLYVEAKSINHFVKKRSVAGLILIDEGKQLKKEFYFENY